MAFDVCVKPFLSSATAYPHDCTLPSWRRLLLEVACIFWGADIYIYFEHRLMHTKYFYKTVHKIHHTYHIPTAFAGFANHWLEAVLFTGASLWVHLVVDVHPVSHAIFG